MAGTGLLDFAWYDYPWALLLLSLQYTAAAALGLHGLLWFSIRASVGWTAPLLAVGLWGGVLGLMTAKVFLSVNFEGLAGQLLILIGFAVPIHLLTIVVWFASVGTGHPMPGRWLRWFIYLQPVLFGGWSLLLFVQHFRVTK